MNRERDQQQSWGRRQSDRLLLRLLRLPLPVLLQERSRLLHLCLHADLQGTEYLLQLVTLLECLLRRTPREFFRKLLVQHPSQRCPPQRENLRPGKPLLSI